MTHLYENEQLFHVNCCFFVVARTLYMEQAEGIFYFGIMAFTSFANLPEQWHREKGLGQPALAKMSRRWAFRLFGYYFSHNRFFLANFILYFSIKHEEADYHFVIMW